MKRELTEGVYEDFILAFFSFEEIIVVLNGRLESHIMRRLVSSIIKGINC